MTNTYGEFYYILHYTPLNCLVTILLRFEVTFDEYPEPELFLFGIRFLYVVSSNSGVIVSQNEDSFDFASLYVSANYVFIN